LLISFDEGKKGQRPRTTQEIVRVERERAPQSERWYRGGGGLVTIKHWTKNTPAPTAFTKEEQ
jgi:hypothetical protein